MTTREELLELIPPFDVRWRMEVVDAIWPIIKKLQQELACDVCAGTGNPPAEICACRGTNNIHEVLLTVRQEYAKLQQENTDLRALLSDACKVLLIAGNHIKDRGAWDMTETMAQRIADKLGHE